jgi:ferredoxin-NADP reductase
MAASSSMPQNAGPAALLAAGIGVTPLLAMLRQADEDDVASLLDDADLANAARQIRELYALRMPL